MSEKTGCRDRGTTALLLWLRACTPAFLCPSGRVILNCSGSKFWGVTAHQKPPTDDQGRTPIDGCALVPSGPPQDPVAFQSGPKVRGWFGVVGLVVVVVWLVVVVGSCTSV